MADTGLNDLFQVQYKSLLNLKLQQKTSLLRSKVEEGSHSGAKMASPMNFVDHMALVSPEGRFAPKSNIPGTYTRRWVLPIDKEGDQLVDSFDQLKTPIDPKSKLVERAAAAVARAYDDEVIRAATASATIGVDIGSLTTEAWDTAFDIAVGFGASAAVGLTVAKLNESRRLLEKNHNTEELESTGATLAIGSNQHADLRNQALVTSNEFNKNGGVLVDGKVTKFMGFDIVVTERLPIIASNVRGCLVFVKSAIYLGMWQDIKTQVFQRSDLSGNPWDISTIVSFGATRTQIGKIVQIACSDSTGADITP